MNADPVLIETSVIGQTTDRELVFKTTDQPDALVEVILGTETIRVRPVSLLLAVRGAVQKEHERIS